MRIVDLQLTLRASGAGYAAEARLSHSGSQADAVLAADAPVALDSSALLLRVLDPAAYGRALTDQLFADPQLRAAWQRARALADGANLPLRLRLRLPAEAGALHALRWETLRDPLTDVPLACDARLRLVRYLDSPDTRPITLGPKPELRALLVIANPRDLSAYGLAEIDVEGEVGRVRKALGSIPLTVVGDHEDAVSRQATLRAVQAALREGPAILCLICHGAHDGDDTTLWLEDDDGKTCRVSGEDFGQMLAQLDSPPLLVTLIACDSGGALAALGPRLALAGVGAVVAMQAKLSLGAARALLPALFKELASDGAMDRAVSVGRAALCDGGEWWVPALWLRVREGRLWAEDAPTPTVSAGIHVGGSVGTVQVVNVSGGQVGSIIGSQHNYGVPLAAAPAASGRAEAIAAQRRRLEQHRATLAHYLGQIAITGSANARPEVTAGIREARAGIARAKAALAALGEAIEDMPDDTP
ncbi:MAG: CHAT domain-containing protein [Chloroflexales bacterium]|nr:CHAT domain-containing protein [Chloroflexales bacterium]